MKGITYYSEIGCFWPDYDHDPKACYDYVQRHLRDMDYAVSRCKKHDVCVQAGGHAGFWPMRLAQVFVKVYTFEAEPLLFECLMRNIGPKPNIIPVCEALGEKVGTAKMLPSPTAGSWRIDPTGTFEVPVTTIDALCLEKCDLLVLDIERYEVEALKGAKKTIASFSPVIHVEELNKSHGRTGDYLRSIGYKLVKKIGKDSVYVR